MVRYQIKRGIEDPHWNALWIEIEKDGPVRHPYDLDSYLKKYNGRVYLDSSYLDLKVIDGIEFRSTEDLVIFKLKFS
jgi:hypothetical protein